MSVEQKAMMDAWQKAGHGGAQRKLLAALVGEWTRWNPMRCR